MSKHGWVVTSLVLVVVACGRGAAVPPRPPPVAAPSSTAAEVPPPLSLHRLLAMLPPDTEVVVGGDLQQLRRSEMIVALLGELDLPGQLPLLRELCGAGIGESTMTITAWTADRQRSITYVRGFDRARVLACIDRARERDDRWVRRDGDYVEIARDDRPSLGFQFADAETIVIAADRDRTADLPAIEAVLARHEADGLLASPRLGPALAQVDTSASFWIVAAGSALPSRIASKVPSKVLAVRGWGRLTTELEGVMVLTLIDAAAAEAELATVAASRAYIESTPALDDLVGTFTAATTATPGEIELRVRATAAQLRKLASVFEQLR